MLIKLIVGVVIVSLVLVMVLTILMIVKPDLFIKTSRPTNENNNTSSNGETEVGDTKDFYPDLSFFPYAFGLGNHTYRALVECTSVNYDLMSLQEQETVEMAYSRFLNSLSFPVTIYIQTREYDRETMMDNLHNNIEQSVRKFPSIQEYASMYESAMNYLPEYIDNTKVKKKFLIIPFDNSDLTDMSALSEEELEEFALSELMLRAENVCANIAACGVTPHICDREEIAECIYSYIYRDYYKIASYIVKGQYSSLAVNGTTHTKDFITQILTESQNRLKALSYNAGPNENKLYMYLFSCIEDLKEVSDTDDLEMFLESVDAMYGEQKEDVVHLQQLMGELNLDEQTAKNGSIGTPDYPQSSRTHRQFKTAEDYENDIDDVEIDLTGIEEE